MEEDTEASDASSFKKLHIVMFPWLAMGHLIPFLRLSQSMALKGHHVSFLSAPRNLLRLPQSPAAVSLLIELVPLSFPEIPNLPLTAQSAMDVPYPKQQLLKIAFDSLEPQVTAFLAATDPDWIIFDYASHWLPAATAALGLRSAYLGLFTAAALSFFGPPEALTGTGDYEGFRSTIDEYTVVPRWVPPELRSTIVYRPHEMAKYMVRSEVEEYTTVTPDTVRFGISISGCDVVAVRTRVEYEPEWFGLLIDLYRKPVIPVGFLPPPVQDDGLDHEVEEKWIRIKEWLDQRDPNSVVYVALGTEATPSHDELTELALGLEESMLPFFWVLRDGPESVQTELERLPAGFLDRVRATGRGVIHTEWAPQSKILSHGSVGGFLTHCGCNSVIEALTFGRVLVMLPMLNDQGLNARQLSEKGVGVEVTRNEKDGSLTRGAVAESLRLAMVDESGESLRAVAREMKGLFGDMEGNDRCADMFVSYLEENRKEKMLFDLPFK